MTSFAEPPVVDAPSLQPTIRPIHVSHPLHGFGKLALLLLAALLLLLAFAPFGQFYLAGLALVPWLFVVSRSTAARAIAWGWLGGFLFFVAGFSYLVLIHAAGAILLAAYLALYWGAAGAMVRWLDLIGATPASAAIRLARSFAFAALWTGLEWLRGNVGLALPLYFLGHAQTPVLPLCQIADATGVYGVSFIVAMVNAMLAQTLLTPSPRAKLWPAWSVVGGVVLAVVLYGLFRMAQSVMSPGPRVLVIQPNDRDFADKTTLDKQRQYVAWHLEKTRQALASGTADLVVWSETVMPSLNPEPRALLRSTAMGNFLEQVHAAIASVATVNDAGVIAGGYYVGYTDRDGKSVPTDYRNSAYFYDRSGAQIGRYDKIHLAPFGEYIPLASLGPLHRLLRRFSPNRDEYNLTPGPPDAMPVFSLTTRQNITARIVTPICLDDLDSRLMSRMFRGPSGQKRADLIVNLTNDGWFRWFEPAQHLQAAIFRSIENRAPTARAVNTGISGFIDSVGRVSGIVPAGVEGASIRQVSLDPRVTLYTRLGDVFAHLMLGITAFMLAATLLRSLKRAGGLA